MNINFDDPKWTAYVLGELDESERAAMESLLESSEEGRAYVEELRIAAKALKEELMPRIHADAALSLEQRASVQAAAEIGQVRWFNRRPPVWLGGLAVAALILIAVAMPSLWHSQRDRGTDSNASLSANAPTGEEGIRNPIESQSQKSSLPNTAIAKQNPVEGANAADAFSNTAVQEGVDTVRQSSTDTAKSPAVPRAEPIPPAAAPAGSVKNAVPSTLATPQLQVQINAQKTAGPSSISGFISDAANALVPGVTVTATNLSTGVATTVLTNESGAYNFVSLPPGLYKLEARLQGFQLASVTNINLGSAESQRFNLTMRIGTASTNVDVAQDANSKSLQSSASVGQVLNADQVSQLAPVSNDVLNLIAGIPNEKSETFANSANTVRDGLTVRDGRQGQQGQQGQAAAGAAATRPQIQQGAQGQAGGGGGRGGGGRASAAPAPAGPAPTPAPVGVGRGAGIGTPAVAGAPPPPPPPPPAAIMRPPTSLPDNRTVLYGDDVYRRPNTPAGNESYDAITDNPFLRVSQEPLSTFSSDVDTASYANVRRYLNQGQLPPRDAVRIEEMVNYFTYDYPQPSGRDPIGAQMEIASAPWNPSHRLVRIGIKARDIDTRRRPPTNLVFLIDVSGSMQPTERLPLIKSGLKMLVNNLTENDHVSIVVYAGASGVRLPSTSGDRKDIINRALDGLEAGGSTNGSSGIQLAYQLATANFIRDGVNRVILATDGDFNLGITNQAELVRLIQERAKSGVFLSVLGVGMGNLKDSTMERLADSGNGNYAYIDSINEASKVLVEQMSGTLITVAKDVKLQVEFNPAVVEAYRLIGYENRLLANQDFNNDRKDAGDMGAGHTVTALYEIVPRGGSVPGPDIDPLKYQTPARTVPPASAGRNGSNETLTLKIRYKDPNGTESKLLSLPLIDKEAQFSKASADFRFAASVAEFGMILRSSPYRGNASASEVLDNAQSGRGNDRNGYRQEFIGLVRQARSIRGLN